MKIKIEYSEIDFPKIKQLILKQKFEPKIIFYFFNLYIIWLLRNNKEFEKAVIESKNVSKSFIDSGLISWYFMAKRMRGPSFTRSFLSDKELSYKKTHFFLAGFSNNLYFKLIKH